MDALKMGIAEKKKRFVGPCWVRFALYPQKWIMRLSCESVPNRKNRYSVSKPGRIRQRRHRPSDRPWAERELERPRKHALRKFGQLTSAYAQVRGGLEISKFFFHFSAVCQHGLWNDFELDFSAKKETEMGDGEIFSHPVNKDRWRCEK